MFLSTALLSSLLALSVSTSSTPPAGPDKCGPEVQIASDPKDSCSTVPPDVNGPSAFGVNRTSTSGSPVDMNWAACQDILGTICDMMNSSSPQKGAWHWATSEEETYSGGHEDGWAQCLFGFWLPADAAAAPVPTHEQCSTAFTALQDESRRETPWYLASINIAANPNITYGGFTWPGSGKGTGMSVNAGYPSYIMSITSNGGQGNTLNN